LDLCIKTDAILSLFILVISTSHIHTVTLRLINTRQLQIADFARFTGGRLSHNRRQHPHR